MKLYKSIIAFTLFFFTSIMGVHAENSAGSGPNPFVDCGIGAALFPDTHWAAISSNVIWDVGTTAVTSATMSPETCSGKDVAVAEFINRTYDNLIEDTAKGEGEYLTAVLNIYGCSTSSQPSIIADLRKNVSKVVSSDTYTSKNQIEKSMFFYDEINSAISSQKSSSCSA